MEIEYRTIKELRLAPEEPGKPPTIEGYAAIFDSRSTLIPPGFVEEMASTAFDVVLESGQDVKALFEHTKEKFLGRRSSGSLKIWKDDRGLKVNIIPPNTETGREVLELMSRGDVTGMSIGMKVEKDDWDWAQNPPVRIIRSISRLFDVSPVYDPVYTETSAEVRSHVEAHLSAGAEHTGVVPESSGEPQVIETTEEDMLLAYYDAILLEK